MVRLDVRLFPAASKIVIRSVALPSATEAGTTEPGNTEATEN